MPNEKIIVFGRIQSWEHFRKCADGKEFAFEFGKKNNPLGDGYYKMVVCFPGLNVDVPFTKEVHSENDYVTEIGKPYACDGPHCQEGKMVEFDLGTDTFLNRLREKALLLKK
jgi:hypothetical protein